MIRQSRASGVNSAAKITPYRVAGFAISDTTFENMRRRDTRPKSSLRTAVGSLLTRATAAVTGAKTPEVNHVAVLWDALDRCVVPAEHRFHAQFGRNKDDIPAALAKIKVTFPDWQHANISILGPLTTDYPALVRSLQVLTIGFNDFDESAVVGAFAALATGLQELSFWWCGLTSLRGLEGRCQYLRKVDLNACKQLHNIDALRDRVYLEEVDLSVTATTSIEPLRTCPNLTKVSIFGCQQLSSIEVLAGHRWLQKVDASFASITSIEPLRSCPNLTEVVLNECEKLPEGNVCLPASVNVIR